MQNINVFHKGIVADIDYSKRDNQSWDFPTINARLLTKDGQGYIITNFESNDFDITNQNDTVGIELPNGFCPIGACEFEGIAYILSWNSQLEVGEIGTYPSPASIISINPDDSLVVGDFAGFSRRYRPLSNFGSLGLRYSMRTSKFNLQNSSEAEIIASNSYDGSVDLYIADGINLNLCINSGFNKKGELLKSRFYTDESFPFFVSHVPLTNKIPKTDDVLITEGGKMLSGNYYFYFKYVTESFNRTHVLHELGPISIYSGDARDFYSIEGIQGDSGISGRSNESTKKISIALSNMDTQYKYVEVSFVRHWSDSTQVVVDDVFTINTLYDITKSNIEIILTGYETLINGTLDEILTVPSKDLICKSHAIIDNRYYGVNWKRYVAHDDRMTELAKRIVPGYVDGNTNTSCRQSKATGYKDYRSVLNKMSYFRTEAYSSGLVFVFKGGIESDVYLTTGIDDINDTAEIIGDGVYRFPDHAHSPMYANSIIRLLAFVFKTNSTSNNSSQSAADYYLANKAWFDENLIGFYFVRGERLKNMMYQGVLIYGCRAYRMKKTGNYLGDYPGIVEQFNNSSKLFEAGNFGDTPQGSLAHGCSNIAYDFSSDESSYYDEDGISDTDTINSDRISLIKDIKGDAGSSYAIWVGQDHKRLVTEYAWSSYWGANRTNSEEKIDHGGKKDHVNDKGDPNRCFYNDHWDNDGVEDGLVMPMWKGFFPCTNVRNKSDERKVAKNYHRRAYYVEKKYALLSSDYILNPNAKAEGKTFMRKLYNVLWNENASGFGTSQIDGDNRKDKDTYPWWWKATIASYEVDCLAVPSIKLTDVQKFTKVNSARNGFVSEYTDPGFEDNQLYGFSSTSTCMWWWYKEDSKTQGAGNRSMSTSKYIGVTLDSHVDDLNLSVASMYNFDPFGDEMKGDALEKFFDFRNIKFKKISRLYTFAELENHSIDTIPHFGGDCFLQQSFYKQMGWRGTSWNIYQKENDELWSGFDKDRRETSNNDTESDDQQKLVNFGHGLVVEMVTENEYNAELRNSFKERTFFPKCGDAGLKSFAVANPDTSDKTESLALNWGYNNLFPIKTYQTYSNDLPYVLTTFPTRIHYSDKLNEGSYINSLRNLRIGNYQDFDNKNGDMLRCFDYMGDLITYQETAINQHNVNSRQAQVDSTLGSLNIGTGDILPAEARMLSTNGIQHRGAAIKGESGILSFDWNMRTINYLALAPSGTGQSVQVMDLSKVKSVSSYIYNICESYNLLTDRKSKFPQDLMNGSGINCGFNKKYSEIYLSVRYAGLSKTLVFNEDVNSFIGEVGFVSPFYLNLNNDFYSIFHSNSNSANKFYRHDIKSSKQNFYGTTSDFKLSFIVNGFSEESNASIFSKRYASLEIESAAVGFTTVKYSTSNQEGLHDNFDKNDNRFWLAPSYAEGKWRFPIQSQTNGSDFFLEQEQNNGSDMRGEWMKVELTYNGTEHLFIKNAVTNYEISNF